MQFRFDTLENIQIAEVIEVFNSAFADYIVKIKLDEKSLAIKMSVENTILKHSVGAFVENNLVGFILLGIENRVAFNGGTGVIPNFRGNHLTEKMYEFILPKLQAEGIYSQQLEVITENIPALKVYQKIGFTRTRTLACFNGKISVSKINSDIKIKPLEKINHLLFQTFWNSNPSWQNSLTAIERTINLHKIIGAFYQNNLVGFLVYTEKGAIKQFAVDKNFRRLGIGQTLFNQLDKKETTITNIDEDDKETCSFLQELGLNLFIRQFEMHL